MNISLELASKHQALKDYFARKESAAVAYSAGVDSTLLMAVAHEVLGDKAIAVTATSQAYPERETREAQGFCAERGIRQILIESNEMSIPGFDHNPENRCYLCKVDLFGHIARIAAEQGVECVVEGTNTDDMDDYRPGFAAVQELGIESPLLDCGFSKQDVRDLSEALGLPTAHKQSFACLYSRFAYGDLITSEKLTMVDTAEQHLLEMGFSTVRVRMVGDDTARIELASDDLSRAVEERDSIVNGLHQAGFRYVALDLQGYRSGSANEGLTH